MESTQTALHARRAGQIRQCCQLCFAGRGYRPESQTLNEQGGISLKTESPITCMISEQLWNAEDLAATRGGLPTGAAMPLCWAYAEYVSLVRSAHDGICFDRAEPVFQSYFVHPVTS